MEFNRKKKKGINQKIYRLWFSAEGYRIIWRKEVFGVSVPACFQACVRTIIPGRFEDGSTETWNFVNRSKQLYKTMKAAVTDCEQHERLWSKAIECTGIRAIQELFGCKPVGVPKWVVTKLDRRVSAILLDTQPGHRVEKEFEAVTPKPITESNKKKRKPTKSSTKPKRKQRSDKGVKRGPRKPKNQ